MYGIYNTYHSRFILSLNIFHCIKNNSRNFFDAAVVKSITRYKRLLIII